MEEPIVFFGTGPVAARSLRLLTQHFRIEAVVTKPRAEHHRGSVPVLELAEQLELPVVLAANKKEVSERVAKAKFKSRVAVLIDFGIIVEQSVIDSFPMGIINSHFSLLPQWRGADPITFALLSGQEKTGVSLMLLVAAMDEGPLIAVGEIELTPEIDAAELTSHLIGLSDKLLTDMLPKYMVGDVVGAPQEKVAGTVGYSARVSYSRKLTKEDGILDWNKSAEQLAREVRAFSEWPKSRCVLGGHAVIITAARAEAGEGKPGELWRGGQNLGVYCAKGILMIDHLKPAGKSEMSIAAFLNGYGKDL
ncbi:MAG TPA: methionyl-tRNA formyltransferase [Candidatus Saccharimonadales bacterium]|nr:methionyl-tRNA formyltransferase [Candidatus Saccharimonadales bacterium]